jgi:hypothetical protein
MKELFTLHGVESFEFSVRRVFDGKIISENIKRSQRWESKVLRRLDVRHNPNWYNASTNADGFYSKEYLTQDHRNKIGDAHRCKIVSEETRLKQSKSQTGKKQSIEQIQKRVEKNTEKTRSVEAIQQTAEKNRGRKNTPEAIHRMRVGCLISKRKKNAKKADFIAALVRQFNKCDTSVIYNLEHLK